MEKKILMLSLGKGKEDVSGHTVDEILVNGLNSYEKIKYSYQDEEIETNYVAEPLIKHYKPDYIYILGTCSSGWVSLYLYFKDGKYESSDIETLRDIELGKYGDNYKEAEKEIDHAIEFLSSKFNAEKVHVILLPVGKNDDELYTIYERLSDELSRDLSEEHKYKVAFDITHSFRSLPFYNYAVLSYFKEVTKYYVSIDKIFYGMSELARENNQHAPIVALDEVNSIMNLTSAVAEFKQTGSVKSLLNYLYKVDIKNDNLDELIQALEKFDWAMGSSDGSAVVDSIDKINKIVNKEFNGADKYTDIIRVLKNALEEEICEGVGGLLDISTTNDPFKYANNQLILATWYLKQHRYSQAACVGDECFRSYGVLLYFESKKETPTIEQIKDEKLRREAIFQRFLKIKPIKNDDLNKQCIELGQAFNNSEKGIDFSRIRNKCAHNLTANNGDAVGYKDIEIIKDFIKKLSLFSVALKNKNKHSKIIKFMMSDNLLKQEMRSTNAGNTTSNDAIIFLCRNLEEKMKQAILGKAQEFKRDAYVIDENIFKDIGKTNQEYKDFSGLKKTCFSIGHYINTVITYLELKGKLEIIISYDIYSRIKENLPHLLQSVEPFASNTILMLTENGLFSPVMKMVFNVDISEYNDFSFDDFDLKYPEKLTEKTPIIKRETEIKLKKENNDASAIRNNKKTPTLASKPNEIKVIDYRTVDKISSKKELKNVILMNGIMNEKAIILLYKKISTYIFDGMMIKDIEGKDIPKNNALLLSITAKRFISWNSMVEGNETHIPPFNINDSFCANHAKEIIVQRKFVFDKNTYIVICDDKERYYKFLVNLICCRLIINQIRKGPVCEENKENFKKVVDAFLK